MIWASWADDYRDALVNLFDLPITTDYRPAIQAATDYAGEVNNLPAKEYGT